MRANAPGEGPLQVDYWDVSGVTAIRASLSGRIMAGAENLAKVELKWVQDNDSKCTWLIQNIIVSFMIVLQHYMNVINILAVK